MSASELPKVEAHKLIEWLKVQKMQASDDYKEYKRRYGPNDNEYWRTQGVTAAINQTIIEIEERLKNRK